MTASVSGTVDNIHAQAMLSVSILATRYELKERRGGIAEDQQRRSPWQQRAERPPRDSDETIATHVHM